MGARVVLPTWFPPFRGLAGKNCCACVVVGCGLKWNYNATQVMNTISMNFMRIIGIREYCLCVRDRDKVRIPKKLRAVAFQSNYSDLFMVARLCANGR